MPTGVGLVVVLGAMSVLGPLSIDLYLPALTDIQSDLHTTESKVQLTLTACLIGLAAGQLVIGSLSDALGRRRPLLAGMGAYVLATAGCALAPSIELLVALRFVQGFCGAAGVVIARSVVRDLFEGNEAVRFFASLMLVSGLAPIVGPLLGAGVLHWTSWHGVFVLIGSAGALLTMVAAVRLAETLPPERRRRGGLRASGAAFRVLLGDRAYVGYIFGAGLGFATTFVYVAASPFVLKDLHGLSSVQFSLVFGTNSMALIGMGQVSRHLVHRFGSRRLFLAGLAMSSFGGAVVMTVVALDLGLVPLLFGFICAVAAIGLIGPNASALALAKHGDRAGSASALQGVAQFVLGAVAAPFAGIAGRDSAMPMAVLMVSLPAVANLVARTLTRGDRVPAGAAADR
jgi:DHA1 family bicyclomycin/chloramphenicol resistance-like MFS transporter